MKATIVLVGRDKDKCEATVEEISNRAGIIVSKSRENRVSYIEADLSLQASIRKLADEFLARHQRLDVLINNAGVFVAKRTTTAERRTNFPAEHRVNNRCIHCFHA